MFKLSDKRYEVDGNALAEARKRCHLTLAQFAAACGWSPQYQWWLESSEGSISEATKNVIEDVLNKMV